MSTTALIDQYQNKRFQTLEYGTVTGALSNMESCTLSSLEVNILGVIVHCLKDPSYYPLVMAVNRTWQQCVEPYVKKWVRDFAFGAEDWSRYYGNVGKVPPLPPHIFKILMGLCSYWEGKRVKDTHFLTLIPESINEVPLTLNTLQESIKAPQGGGHASAYKFYSEGVKKELGKERIAAPYWALMTKYVLPGSRNKTFIEQEAILQADSRYRVPKALETTVVFLTHRVKKKVQFHLEELSTYTRCAEKVHDKVYRVIVGALDSAGLIVNNYFYGDGNSADHIGLRALRKL